MKLDFSGKTVLITGATRGIGKATAELFESSNAQLLLTGTKKHVIDELNKTSNAKRKKYFRVNFSNEESVENFLNELRLFPKIDVLINNAGINIIEEFIEAKSENFDEMVKINLKGPFLLSQTVAKKMKENYYGRIINIASIWSIITRRKRSIYTMTKNALHGMTQTMSIELAKFNIMVNTVSPGFTLTELTKSTNTKEEIKKISSDIPIGRMAEPVEMAKVILFLASEHNTYLTGQNIIVDGGFTNV